MSHFQHNRKKEIRAISGKWTSGSNFIQRLLPVSKIVRNKILSDVSFSFEIFNSLMTLYLSNCLINCRKGRFTEEEDKKIKLYMKGETDSNNKCAQLAKILGRTRQSVCLRFRLLKKNSTFKRKKEGKPCSYTISDLIIF